ncbi:polyprenyl synthetase family protein [Clostridium drakei]|uniref:Heptaprenyl diphosphate synthase n=1 Tax=Clostridium drakei TaxID=332101 RepID=A0A2U8DW91_9CLOT|nr:polyprenyl synthetase family protein [Clostridium drakei]AWI06910.1 heptaprenyl diphosphate synthase [Clostridium drakei]
MDNFWSKYPSIQYELNQVKDIMKKNVRCIDKFMEDIFIEMIDSGGKLLRPAFVILGGHFGKYNKKDIHNIAAATEMLHMATLIHDDIVDNALLRRGKQTIQSGYGKKYAVYMGDFLLSKSLVVLTEISEVKNLSFTSKSISRICLGEMEQFLSQKNQNVTIKQYLRRISAKTAELFSISLYMSALHSKCNKKICRNLWHIGHNIGMAFQIIDDILDFCGDEVAIRKSAGNDLREGIYTLPIIYALKDGNSDLSSLLSKNDLCDEDIRSIVSMVNYASGVEKTKKLAQWYTDKAFQLIQKLPDNEYKNILNDITKTLLIREY